MVKLLAYKHVLVHRFRNEFILKVNGEKLLKRFNATDSIYLTYDLSRRLKKTLSNLAGFFVVKTR